MPWSKPRHLLPGEDNASDVPPQLPGSDLSAPSAGKLSAAFKLNYSGMGRSTNVRDLYMARKYD